MKSIFKYLVLILLCYSCNTDNKMSKSNEQCNKKKEFKKNENSNNLIDFRTSIVASDSIYEKRRDERLDFCRVFVNALKKRDLKEIENKIEFPFFIECFVGKQKGDTVSKIEFISYYDRIFDNVLIEEMERYIYSLNNSNSIYDFQKGFDLRDDDFFTLSTSYKKPYENNGIEENFEYSRLFRFEKRNDRFKLIIVFCAE
jgi:hypothetical protein